ncbi:MAG: Fe(3+) ABC transporter substrate-binding protein [Pseudomonadales bacterium]|nr:Fe(3+) ABC transporter substrate-binding protein [Pseudomonadales bacterium]
MKETLILATCQHCSERRFTALGRLAAILTLTLASIWPPALVAQEVVNVYSARHYDTDMALYEEFTRQTGIEVNLIEGGSDALIERIVNEGEFTQADMLLTVDAGRLWRASEQGIFQSVTSELLNQRVPDNLKDPDGLWFGLSKRVRAIAYNTATGLPIDVARYEDLANPALTGAVCMRSSSNIYNLSLMSSIIEATDEAAAEAWASGVVKNFARKPQGNDTAQLRAVASGECGITVANTYYLGRLIGSDDAKNNAITDALTVVFPNQDDRGAHVNISGAGVTRYAPNKDNAIKFLEYLTSDFAQKLFAEGNNEYPIVGAASGPVASLGDFSEDTINAAVLGERQAEAVRVFDRAGWQ